MRGLMKKVALFLNIFHFQYPIVIFHPAPDGGAGKVCHVVDLRIGQAAVVMGEASDLCESKRAENI